LEQSKRVYEALGLLDDLTFEAGDVRAAPKDLSSFDVVYFNATLGTSTREKEDMMLDVARRMRPGALVLTRSTYSLKTMAYPVSLEISFIYRLSTCLIHRILTCCASPAC
jgi:nicotianamine synthase